MEQLKQKLIRIRRTIHAYPELGNHEFKTARFIEKELHNIGIATRRIGATGIVGVLQVSNADTKKCFALRADMDALPVKTEIRASYASTVSGCMHACGHDANMAVVLGAAALLAQRRKKIKGAVKFIFQPNEESAGGALEMIRKGVLKNPRVDAIMGIHVNPQLTSGTIGLKRGPMMAAVDRFILEIIGEGGHGAYPHKGIDAIAVAGDVIQAINQYRARCIDPTEPVVITIGKIAGGERFNILPGRVVMEGTVRTLSKKMHQTIRRDLACIIKNQVQTWGAHHRWIYEVLGEPLVNHDGMLTVASLIAQKSVGKKSVVYLEKPSMGGEDFAEFLKCVPGCFVYLGTKKNNKTSFAWHHPKFDIDENALIIGATFLADMAQQYVTY